MTTTDNPTTNPTTNLTTEGRKTMTEDTIIDKITKLLAKAESTTPEEAEALTAKATELMMRWSIDEAVIEARRVGAGKVDQVVEKKIWVSGIYWKANRDIAFA